jgi:diacylglycerol kinase (ATP)
MKSPSEKISFRARLASFKYAFQGLRQVLKVEQNIWAHLLAAITAIVLGAIFQISKTDWLIIILCIGLVLIAEIMNSAIEELVDLVSPQRNEKAGKIKDIAAGGVLIAAITALVAGIIVFLPYLT